LEAGDDAAAIVAWQRSLTAPRSFKGNLKNIDFRFNDVSAAGLRSGQFGVVWSTAAALEHERSFRWSQHKLAETIAKASRTQGRAAAYALAAHGIEVLAQDAATRATCDGLTGPEPISFLRGILSKLTEWVTDPALLRDIASLLEQRLPSETVAERALLEAAARRAEKPDDPSALERVDPDIATVLERISGAALEPTSKAPPRRGKRGGAPRRKK
jgi:hypothetical protein